MIDPMSPESFHDHRSECSGGRRAPWKPPTDPHSSLQRRVIDELKKEDIDEDIDFEDKEVDLEIIFSKDEDGVTAAVDGIENHICFYDVLANHYVKVPENGYHILELIVQLWSQSFVSHIFALLFHKWI